MAAGNPYGDNGSQRADDEAIRLALAELGADPDSPAAPPAVVPGSVSPHDTGGIVAPHASGAIPVTPMPAANTGVFDTVHADPGSTGVSSPAISATTARVTGAAGRHGSRRASQKKSPLSAIFGILVMLGVLGGAFYFFVLPMLTDIIDEESVPTTPVGQMVNVSIPEGSGAAAIAQLLNEAGVVQDVDEFMKALNKQNAEQSLKPGTYSFVTGANVSEVVRQLVIGPNNDEFVLAVPEGLRVDQVAALVESRFGIPAADFEAAAVASRYAGDYPFLAGVENDSLEGYLFPKTYDFSGKEITAELIIRAMLAQYQIEAGNIDFDSAIAQIKDRYGVTMTPYDIIKLASIIEKETPTTEDRPLVASVFYNRLQQGMNLQSDATMSYVTHGDVTAEDLNVDSPYNSYFYSGFPPTPICSPSLEAVNAALNPADSDYLYFYIVENESYSNHSFSRTFEEHQAVIEQAMRDQAQ